ncbi:hypothetical protein V2J09_018687 [Rumex salicifolius]
MDVKKLKDAGLCPVEFVSSTPRKDLLQFKGISEAKVDKIVEVVSKLIPMGFTSARHIHEQREQIIQITTGLGSLINHEVTHRAKSVSIAKFTSQEVTSLQDFIKHVNVDRRYSGERSSVEPPPRVKLVSFIYFFPILLTNV